MINGIITQILTLPNIHTLKDFKFKMISKIEVRRKVESFLGKKDSPNKK
jgi:hypothetical protein